MKGILIEEYTSIEKLDELDTKVKLNLLMLEQLRGNKTLKLGTDGICRLQRVVVSQLLILAAYILYYSFKISCHFSLHI